MAHSHQDGCGMTATYPIGAVLGIAIAVLLGLLLPYLGPNRRELIATTSLYRPISLVMLIGHCGVTLLIAVERLPYSPVPPLLMGWALVFTALEIRHARTRRKPSLRVAVPVVIGSAMLLLAFSLFTELALRNRAITHTLFLTALVGWITYEAYRAWRVSRNIHYTVVLLALTSGLVALAIRDVMIMNEARVAMATIAYETRAVIQMRFIAYGFLCFALLALNHAYGAQLWRAAVFRRQSRELLLVSALRDVAQVRDNETGNHIVRTSRYVRILARNLAAKAMLDDGGQTGFVSMLARAAPLHDVGKVSIPDNILLKPGRHSEREQKLMRTHAAIGAEILRAASEAGEDAGSAHALLQVAQDIARAHHENWDGSGYPLGLSGAAIPQSARIMALADVYDALTSARPYKAPWTHEDAVAYIQSLSGSKFDPDIVEAFVEEAELFRATAARLRDTPSRDWMPTPLR